MAKKRRYINVDIEVTERVYVGDILEEVEDDDLLQECIDRELIRKDVTKMNISKESLSAYFGVSRHTPIEKFIELVKNELETEV